MTNKQVDCPDPPTMAIWLRETARNTRRYSDSGWTTSNQKQHDPVAAHVAFRLEQAADMIEALHGSAEEWMDRYMVASGNMAPTASPAEPPACPKCRVPHYPNCFQLTQGIRSGHVTDEATPEY